MTRGFGPFIHMQAVRYIGRKTLFTDNLYGSGLTFTKDQVRSVPPELADQFLRHGDSFERAEAATPKRAKSQDDTAELLEQARIEQEAKAKERDELQDLRDQINQMDKTALDLFARTNYRQELDRRHSVHDLRVKVIGLVDQFGAV